MTEQAPLTPHIAAGNLGVAQTVATDYESLRALSGAQESLVGAGEPSTFTMGTSILATKELADGRSLGLSHVVEAAGQEYQVWTGIMPDGTLNPDAAIITHSDFDVTAPSDDYRSWNITVSANLPANMHLESGEKNGFVSFQMTEDGLKIGSQAMKQPVRVLSVPHESNENADNQSINTLEFGPPAEVFRPKPSKFTHEPIPARYTAELGANKNPTHHELNSTLLKKLAEELLYGDPQLSHELVKNAYGVAREIADGAIGDRSSKALDFLSYTRTAARYRTKFYDNHGVAGDGRAAQAHVTLRNGGTEEEYKEMGVDISSAYQNSVSREEVNRKLTEFGAEIQPEHVALLTFLQSVGHEAGHLAEAGIAELIPAGAQKFDVLSRTPALMLQRSPQDGMTGDLVTDLGIQSERFAEGYGMLVMTEAARALGYDELTTQKLVDAVAFTEEQDHAVGAQSGIVTIAGYSRHLSIDTIIRDLEYVEDNILAGRETIDLSQDTYNHRRSAPMNSSGEESQIGQQESTKRRRVKLSAMIGAVGTRNSRV